VRYQIPPSTVLGPSAAHASGTVEHMHVMHVAAGTVRVTVGDETAELSAGDSCSCRTDAPHGVQNPRIRPVRRNANLPDRRVGMIPPDGQEAFFSYVRASPHAERIPHR
jgi:hypothetical protein